MGWSVHIPGKYYRWEKRAKGHAFRKQKSICNVPQHLEILHTLANSNVKSVFLYGCETYFYLLCPNSKRFLSANSWETNVNIQLRIIRHNLCSIKLSYQQMTSKMILENPPIKSKLAISQNEISLSAYYYHFWCICACTVPDIYGSF